MANVRVKKLKAVRSVERRRKEDIYQRWKDQVAEMELPPPCQTFLLVESPHNGYATPSSDEPATEKSAIEQTPLSAQSSYVTPSSPDFLIAKRLHRRKPKDISRQRCGRNGEKSYISSGASSPPISTRLRSKTRMSQIENTRSPRRKNVT